MKQHLRLTMMTCLAYCLDKELWKAIDDLKEQVRVLKEQQEKDKRILLNDRQKIRLIAKAKQLTRELLAACDFFSVELLVKGRLVRCMVLFAIDVATHKVEILGIRPQPNGPWMEQIARNIRGEGGFVAGKKYLIHDRDPLFTAKFESILKTAGVECVRLPPRSPNSNAHAERFVRSVKEECLDHLILFSEEQLRYVLSEYLQDYHHERIHQGINRVIEPQHEGSQGEIICIPRLGEPLKSYHRKAA